MKSKEKLSRILNISTKNWWGIASLNLKEDTKSKQKRYLKSSKEKDLKVSMKFYVVNQKYAGLLSKFTKVFLTNQSIPM